MFAVVWFGSPHGPWKALDADQAAFSDLEEKSSQHYGELAAMDRSLGTLRAKLRELHLAEKTLLVFCSDNGGLPGISPASTGGLRGFKGSVYEGGIRVPGILEWPGVIQPRVTNHPACVMDLFPTVVDLLGLPESVMVKPVDGISLRPLFQAETGPRSHPIGFRYHDMRALVDNHHKVLTNNLAEGSFELYDLQADPHETRNLATEQPERLQAMKQKLLAWDATVDASFSGKDYPEGKVSPPDPESVNWFETSAYKPYLEEWKQRWEYKNYLERPPGYVKPEKKKKKTKAPQP
jgi:arylsulfatase A-like enzyme